jgi:nucleoid-associated protein YgaU
LSRYDREREALDSLWAATAAQRVVGGGTIFLRHAGAVLVAAAAVVLTFSLSPRPTAPELHPSSAASRAVAAAAAPTASAPDLTPQTLVRALRAFDGYPPQRAAAYTIGLLREYGVPLDSVALAFHAADVVVSGPDDTWQSVARSTMDDPALWPMVILLNMDKTQDGEFVPPGTYLRVPKTSAESGT